MGKGTEEVEAAQVSNCGRIKLALAESLLVEAGTLIEAGNKGKASPDSVISDLSRSLLARVRVVRDELQNAIKEAKKAVKTIDFEKIIRLEG